MNPYDFGWKKITLKILKVVKYEDECFEKIWI